MKAKSIAAAVLVSLIISGTALAAPILKQNDSGHDVIKLQNYLKAAGYEIGDKEGEFGYSTYRAVAAFQRDSKIHITGTVNRETWNALKKRTNGKKPSAAEPGAGSAKPAAEPGAVRVEKSSAPFLTREKAAKIIASAKKYKGARYQFGGATPKGFDCSGFLQYVFRQNGLAIARTADEQYKMGKPVKKRSELLAGDLVFFSTYEKGASHCGIYLGKNEFIHVSSSKGVRVDSLDDVYWKPRWYGGRHIVKG